jgi:thiazole biosynthesis enzyme
MKGPDEIEIARVIVQSYHENLERALQSNVIVVGAGPSGLMAADRLARSGFQVVLLEKNLTPGGGIWGGSMGMNQVVVQEEAAEVLDGLGARGRAVGELFVLDAGELASALYLRCIQAGVRYLNLMTAEDLSVHQSRVVGVVANRSLLGKNLPLDPLVFSADAVIDATGHEAVLVECLKRRRLLIEDAGAGQCGEGPMDAAAGERFVVDKTSEVYPGLWMAGMAVCRCLGGPRMGPIFGGMLLSGLKAAEQVSQFIARYARCS